MNLLTITCNLPQRSVQTLLWDDKWHWWVHWFIIQDTGISFSLAGKAVCSWLRGWGRPGKHQGARWNSQELKGAGRDLKMPPNLQVPCWSGARGRKNMVLALKSCFLAFCAYPHLAARGIWSSTSRCFPSSCHSLLAQSPLLFPDPVLCSRQHFVLFLFCPLSLPSR